MKLSTKIWSAAAILLLMIAALAANVVQVRVASEKQPNYTTNAGELVHDVLFGQTFYSSRPNLSAVAVQFATYSNRHNTKPILFYLRSSIESKENIRTASVTPDKLRDNQTYRFDFEPIVDSKGKSYFFFIVSPDSASGDAVTVDVDSRDPYVNGSAFIVRGQGSNITDPAVLARAGKPALDLTFNSYNNIPVREAVVNAAITDIRYAWQTYPQHKGLYIIWARSLVMALLLILTIFLVSRSPKAPRHAYWWLLLFLVVSFAMRVLYAQSLPFTDDEGNYLYDARTLLEGHLAGGDGYVKTPLVVVWIALWHVLMHGTLLAARMSSIVIGSLTIFPLYVLGRELWGRRTAIVVAALWATAGAAIVFNIYVHTQPLALFFAVSGVAVLLMALRGTTPRLTFITERTAPSALGWFFFAGMLLGLGAVSRKSVIGIGLAPLFAILFVGKNWKQRLRELLAVGAGFLLVIALFIGCAYFMYGPEGIKEAIGINSAEDGLAAVDPEEADKVTAYSLRGMTPFFRESLPLIFLAVLGWGMTLEKTGRRLLEKIKRRISARWLPALDQWLPKLLWILPAWAFLWARNFFFDYEGSVFITKMYTDILWSVFAVAIAAVALWPRAKKEAIIPDEDLIVAGSTQPLAYMPVQSAAKAAVRPLNILLVAGMLCVVWLDGLAFFYENWIKFHANYIAEFIPPLVILAGAGAVLVWRRLRVGRIWASRAARFVFAGIIIWAMFISNYITYTYEHTGTFDQSSLREAAAWAKAHIPSSEPIFTGAALVPYLSGHHVALDIAHPRWYAYDFTRNNPKRLNTFLPPASEMQQAFREAHWFLMDSQTGFSFIQEYSDIEKGLATDFVPVKQIDNGGNTLTFYERVAAAK
jgi:hypothetical protein